MDKKKAGDNLQGLATGLTGMSALVFTAHALIKNNKENNLKDFIISHENDITQLNAAIAVGDIKDYKFVDTRDYINTNGELVTGKYISFNKIDKVKQLKAEIKDTKTEDMVLSFSQNAVSGGFSILFGMAAACCTYVGIRTIRNLNVFKPKAANEL